MKKLKIKKIISSLNEISHFNRYLILTIVFLFSYIFYLSLPSLYDYESLQKQLEIKLLEEFKLKITLSKNIKYIASPWPYFEIFDSTLYLETKDKVNELGKIKKLKIYISTRNLYKQKKLKIKKILFQESIFNLNNNSWKFLSDYLQNKPAKKKIFVKKSKIFLKQNNDYGALAIFTIDNLDTFFNDKTNHNKLNIYGKGFNTSFDLKWTSDLNNLGKSKFLLKFKEINLVVKSNLQKDILKEKIQYTGDQTINFIGSRIKTNVKFDNKLLIFSSQDSKINDSKISTHGKINFHPFFFNINFVVDKMNLSRIFDEKFLVNDLINSDIYFHKNFNGNLTININNLTKNKIFDQAKFIINFNNGKMKFDNTELISEKFGFLTLFDSQLTKLNEDSLLRTKAVLDITNEKKFYQRFQIPKNLRKPLNKIIFGIDKNLNTNDLKIYKFEIYPKTENYPSEDIELFLKNYNLSDYAKVNSFFDLKKFLNEIFKEINKV